MSINKVIYIIFRVYKIASYLLGAALFFFFYARRPFFFNSYTELQAPKSLQGQNMILQDITFSNKKKYLLDDKSSLVCINHIEQQDKRVKRTELVVSFSIL